MNPCMFSINTRWDGIPVTLDIAIDGDSRGLAHVWTKLPGRDGKYVEVDISEILTPTAAR